eukprot:TRINITY_DN10887_c0_g3_i1.p1 TRINITY_DN10887_c0_g3~~TRINITY_DN10887_c0_g3_i1.p1  ORF type:complete len:852 (+),score=332.28 TRINITY_DN10887_c0_g3_i1:210-2558(+)
MPCEDTRAKLRRYTTLSESSTAVDWETETSSSLFSSETFMMDFGSVDFISDERRAVQTMFHLASTAPSGGLVTSEDEARIRASLRVNSYSQMTTTERSRLLHEKLAMFWGFDSFRPGQYEVLDAVLQGQDAMAIMPTGHGKSLCYQLPAVVSGKPTLVISPLIALMHDQVAALGQRGIAAEFSGAGNAYVQDWNDLDVLFMSPESAVMQRSRLEQTNFGLIAIDEAHCVSEWGADFRPAYRELSLFRDTHPDVPLLTITATATSAVAQDIASVFSLPPDHKLVLHSFNRPNLHYSVREMTAKAKDEIVNIVQTETCSIIYMLTVEECNNMYDYLWSKGINAGKYHGSMNMTERMHTQRRFMADELQTIVCTVAFGMGIDKPDVRHVIHYGYVKSMTDYYQQTGRAGRDGMAARCTMFISPSMMVSKLSFVLRSKTDPLHRDNAMKEMLALVDYADLSDSVCRRVPLLAHFGEKYTPPEGGCGACNHCDGHSDPVTDPIEIGSITAGLLGMMKTFRYPLPITRLVEVFKGVARGQYDQRNRFFKVGQKYTPEFIRAVMNQLRVEGCLSREVYETSRTKQLWMGWTITAEGRKRLSQLNRSKPSLLITDPIRELRMAVKAERKSLMSTEAHDAEVKRGSEKEEAARRVGGVAFFPLRALLKAVRASEEHGDHAHLPDATLETLCRVRPSTDDAMRRVVGVPGNLSADLVSEYVAAIRIYCINKGHPVDVEDKLAGALAEEEAQRHAQLESPSSKASLRAPAKKLKRAAPVQPEVPKSNSRLPFL